VIIHEAFQTQAGSRHAKGRGYLKYDYASHGAPHKLNSPEFWAVKKEFGDKYGVQFTNFGSPVSEDTQALMEEFETNLQVVMSVLRQDQALVDYLADTLVSLGESVPSEISAFKLGKLGNPFEDERLVDYRNYPADLYMAPGSSVANRAALAKWSSWVKRFWCKELWKTGLHSSLCRPG